MPGSLSITKRASYVKKNKSEWIKLGRCRRCGKPANKTKSCEHCLQLHRLSQIRRSRKRKLQVQQAYGGKCVHCGKDDPDILCLDHINGGGRKHREKLGGSDGVYKQVINAGYPTDFRLLCYNCNIIAYLDSIPEPINQRAAKARKWRLQFKRKVLEQYGGAHCSCGETDIRVLCLDHKDGNGVLHRKSINGSDGTKMLRWAHRNGYPPIFQILCANCNAKKESRP